MTHRWIIAAAILWLVPVAGEAGAKTFHGAPCTQDCSGHKAGYDWARKKQVTALDQCRGRSNSFVEGCRIWVIETQAPSGAQWSERNDAMPAPGE